MDDRKFGTLTEQGFLGDGFGFTEASDEEKKKFETEDQKDSQWDRG